MANLPQINGNISRVLKAPTKPVINFASLQPLLDEHGFLYASDKEDGIRCITHPVHGPCSQTMKPIPNKHITTILSQVPKCLDGELVAVNSKGEELSFNDTQSAVMSEEGQPRFEYRVFDYFRNVYFAYEDRLSIAQEIVEGKCGWEQIYVLPHFKCRSIEIVELNEESALKRGKEGIMLNSPRGWYKEGRSTFNEGYLLKVKRFEDDEAIVVSVEEEMENCNPATLDVGGLQKRSKHLGGLKGKGCVGVLICKWRGKEIRIGSGLTASQKSIWWQVPSLIVGKTITFKFQRHGMKDLPRAPIFKGIRYDV